MVAPSVSASPAKIAAVAGEVFATLGTGRQIPPFTARPAGLSLDEAYRAGALLNAMQQRERGAKPVGRKIGFTNHTIWQQYNVYAPIWGFLYDQTVHELGATPVLPLAAFAAPRIEPEIVFGLSAAPSADMDDAALLGCIAWVAHGFEIVQSIFPDWKFLAADTVAANALHAALLIGPRHPIGAKAADWRDHLASFEIDLFRDGALIDHGCAANVLGGPLSALRHLVEVLAADLVNPALAAGEVVTTGTLTKAMPVQAGETWHTAPRGIDLGGVTLRFG